MSIANHNFYRCLCSMDNASCKLSTRINTYNSITIIGKNPFSFIVTQRMNCNMLFIDDAEKGMNNMIHYLWLYFPLLCRNQKNLLAIFNPILKDMFIESLVTYTTLTSSKCRLDVVVFTIEADSRDYYGRWYIERNVRPGL